MEHNNTQQIIIIGGGIAGMTAAYEIQKEAQTQGRAVTFTLIEAGDRLGGKIVTEQVDGFTIEGGPDCVIRQKPWASELALTLGLGSELIGTNDSQRKVYVLNRGRLTPLPDGVMLIVPTKIMPFVTTRLISWPGKIRMGLDLLISRRESAEDETVGQFVRRRLGSEALEKIAEPLLSGIHVSDPEEQSLLATFPRFRTIEMKYGSLTRGMIAERRQAAAMKKAAAGRPASPVPQSTFVSLKNGLGQLVQTLAANLTAGRIIRGVRAVGLDHEIDGIYTVTLENGETITGDAVILATPAYAAADLVQPIAPQIAGLLNSIPYVSTATVSLGYRTRDIRKPFTGHGLLVPKIEKRPVSACTFSSFKFNHRAPADHVLLRCFVGGPGHEDQVDLSDEAMLDLVRQELKHLLAIDAAPVVTRIFRWRKANPQYTVGHLERVAAIRTGLRDLPGLYVTGSAYAGVGVPDCVKQGRETAQNVLEYLGQCDRVRT